MKFAAFKELTDNNAYNALDRKEGEKFTKERNETLSAWRKFIYKQLSDQYGDIEEIDEVDGVDLDKNKEENKEENKKESKKENKKEEEK